MSEVCGWRQWQLEAPAAPGKHTKVYPAAFAHGYRFNPLAIPEIDHRPRPMQAPYSMRDRVNRAIPVDGTVKDIAPTWSKSPQVKFWLEEPKKSLRQRIIAWLRRPARG